MLNQVIRKRCKHIGNYLTTGEKYDIEVKVLKYGVVVRAGDKILGYNNLIEFAADWENVLEDDDE